ncbi:MAG: rhodanese-like domain-containing protein [Flavobacteriaceae bacterium]
MKILKILFITFLCIGLSQNIIAQSTGKGVIKNIEPKELSATLNNNIQLVDVRTPNEFKSGHIKGSVNMNYYDQDFSTQIGKLDKSKPIYVYCRSGVRSKYSSEILKKLGFKKIYNLKGGILNWNTNKLPLKK